MNKINLIIEDFKKSISNNKFILFDPFIPNSLIICEYHQLDIKTNLLFVIYYTSSFRDWKTTIINELGISIMKRSTETPYFIPWDHIKNVELNDNHSITFYNNNSDKSFSIDKRFFSLENKIILNIVTVLNDLLTTFKKVKNNEAPQFIFFSDLKSPNEKFHKWLIESFEYVQLGDDIFQYYNSESILKVHKVQVSGYIERIAKNSHRAFFKNKIIYKIYECEEDIDSLLMNFNIFKNEPEVIEDKFTKTKNISWKRVSSYSLYSNGIKLLSNNHNFKINFRLFYDHNNDYIAFEFFPNELNLKKNDTIEILFQNGSQITYTVHNKLNSLLNDEGKRIIQFKSKMLISELNLLALTQIDSWKITLNSKGISVYGGEKGGDPYYSNKKSLSLAIIKYARDYKQTISEEIPNYEPLQLRDNRKSIKEENIGQECYVYLMKDETNNFFKIGISNKPEYREYTLQSEKPTIKLLQAKKFPIRKIASSFEKGLHEIYNKQRIRGEWFNLSDEDVQHIISSLK